MPGIKRVYEERVVAWRSPAAAIIPFLLWLTFTPACRTDQSGHPYRTAGQAQRNPDLARRHNDQGLRLVEQRKLEEAEQEFKRSLENDLYYAPAHNNLGLVLLQTHRFYEAAWEFECAAKLAPASAEPRVNLAALYEETGRLDPAIAHYEQALTIEPTNTAAMRHLARAYIKGGRKDPRTRELLESSLGRPGEPQWDVWARGQLIRLGRGDDVPPDDGPAPTTTNP